MRYLLLLAGAGCLAAAAPPVCRKTGKPPVLNGDPFSPVECSSAPRAALPLAAEPEGAPLAPDLKALKGRWEGLLIKGFGRYQVALEVKTGWGGKAEARMDWKEQQTRMAGSSTLSLSPAKGKGLYKASMGASVLPGAALEGEARFSGETDRAGAPLSRGDFLFANGASHRLRWSLPAKDTLRFAASWAVPEAPLVQELSGELKRAR